MFEEIRFEDLLKSLRVRKGKVWTQAKTAKLLGVSLRTYVGWENGESLPSHRDLKNVAAAFGLNDADTNMLFRTAAKVAPEKHNLPFPRNPLFTGREILLKKLNQLFKKNDSIATTQPVSISGLAGIGKTQLALEYAHRCYPNVYRCVLWVNAADRVTLEASYLSLAQLLNLPEKNEKEVDCIIRAVQIWLEEHTNWLLIFDNADNLLLAHSFFPTKPCGHILLTTRSQIVGNIATPIEIEAMELDEGLLFLLRRSRVLHYEMGLETVTSDIRYSAAQLVELLGGHPLALDQAGAYIEETQCNLSDYQQRYQTHRTLLLKRRGGLAAQHPEPVATTFLLAFENVEQKSKSAAELLKLCAFLSPDAIPEELITKGAIYLGPLLQSMAEDPVALDEAIAASCVYSLLRRNAKEKILTIHRLVQTVLKDGMSEHDRKLWIERVVQATEAAFPDGKYASRSQYERLLPHAQECVTLVKESPILSTNANKAAEKLRRRLVHLTKYRTIQQLENVDTLSPLVGKLLVTLRGKQVNYVPGEQPEPEPFAETDGKPLLKSGEWTFLSIKNASSYTISISVFSLSPDWSIVQIYPYYESYHTLAPGEDITIELQAELPPEAASTTDILKIFATTGSADFQWIQLPTLDAHVENQKSTRTPLEELRSVLRRGTRSTRAFLGNPYKEWITAQIEVDIQP